MRRVLVTRPQPGADATAERIARMGFQPIVLPLTRVVPVMPDTSPDPQQFDAVVLTSINAIRHSPPALVSAAALRPAFAVGDATAEMARASGFREVYSASGTAIDLAALLRSRFPDGARLLHLTGKVRTASFDRAIAEAGFGMTTVEVYDTEKISHSTDFLAASLGEQPIWGALVLSTLAGELTADLIERIGTRQLFKSTNFFCISEKAASPVSRLGAGETQVSAEPTEAGVLALLPA